MKELKGFTSFTPSTKITKAIKEERTKFLKGINRTTFNSLEKKIKKAIDESIVQGLTKTQLAKKIKAIEAGVFTDKIASAKAIARTETSALATATRDKIMKDEGVTNHEWVTEIDDVTRGGKSSDQADHISLDGEVRKLGDTFSNGLTHPLENGAAPEEVVNCRCLTIAVR